MLGAEFSHHFLAGPLCLLAILDGSSVCLGRESALQGKGVICFILTKSIRVFLVLKKPNSLSKKQDYLRKMNVCFQSYFLFFF